MALLGCGVMRQPCPGDLSDVQFAATGPHLPESAR